MKPFPESYIREKADEPTLKILDLWKKLSKDLFNYSIEVILCDRKDNPELKFVQGELNTAYPGFFDGKIVLSIWLEHPKSFDPIIITHEIGHWILMVTGFKGLVNKYGKQSEIDINMNSLAQHSPLYTLQRKFGHDPQKLIDTRAKNNLNALIKTTEYMLGDRWAEFALLFADDVINCSEYIKNDLMEVLKQEYPVTLSFLEKILNIVSKYDLNEPKSNLAFLKSLVNTLYLGEGWKVMDEIVELKETIKENELKK
ncbi:MAG: hypothetical protein AMQ74_00596 [Candidatus Methanofastidiosum methylothiophilum]|uniref:Uncharacterized protein n=1 Tax=Candidatus Methanofastidiosum methylothiophilum TaxID=1705564 RepID=A0A150J6T5_9EURY|nr:MAG: hypothetical protein AMQ74_00596 [Candidatus Methanofastidiosum methylthiophilus]